MNITELKICMTDCYSARLPLLIRGGPGIAKTDLAEQLAIAMGADFHPFNAATIDPSKFGITMPRVDNSACDIVPTAQFIDVAPGSFCFLDEMDKLDPLIQNCLLPMIQNNRLDGIKLTDRWYVMAANRMSDGKGTYDISPFIRNRCAVVDFDGPTVTEWCDYAVSKGVDYRIIAYHESNHGKFLNKYDPQATASPTPRQWMHVNKIINSSMCQLLSISLIGPPAAADFEVFLKLTSKIPTYSALLATRGNYAIPDSFVLQAILATMLGQNLTGADAVVLKAVIDQLPVEFIAMLFKRAMLRKAKGFDQFIVQNGYLNMVRDALAA